MQVTHFRVKKSFYPKTTMGVESLINNISGNTTSVMDSTQCINGTLYCL